MVVAVPSISKLIPVYLVWFSLDTLFSALDLDLDTFSNFTEYQSGTNPNDCYLASLNIGATIHIVSD